MGKLESKPELRGESPNLSIYESNYFFRVNKLLRNSYINNMYNDANLNNSLELKSFKSNPTHPKNFGDISWLEYITNYIEDVKFKSNYSWCDELLFFISEQSFISETKYSSIFFYNEYLIKTIPKVLCDDKDIDNDENIIEVDKVENAYN